MPETKIGTEEVSSGGSMTSIESLRNQRVAGMRTPSAATLRVASVVPSDARRMETVAPSVATATMVPEALDATLQTL